MRGRERGLGLLLSVVFWGVGAVVHICQLRKLLPQTTPTAARRVDKICVVLQLETMQKADDIDKSYSQLHFDLFLCAKRG